MRALKARQRAKSAAGGLAVSESLRQSPRLRHCLSWRAGRVEATDWHMAGLGARRAGRGEACRALPRGMPAPLRPPPAGCRRRERGTARPPRCCRSQSPQQRAGRGSHAAAQLAEAPWGRGRSGVLCCGHDRCPLADRCAATHARRRDSCAPPRLMLAARASWSEGGGGGGGGGVGGWGGAQANDERILCHVAPYNGDADTSHATHMHWTQNASNSDR